MANLIPGKARALNTANNVNIARYVALCRCQHGANWHHSGSALPALQPVCETEWHVVRVKCSNCEQSGKLHYWSLDDEQAAIKAESCDDCGT